MKHLLVALGVAGMAGLLSAAPAMADPLERTWVFQVGAYFPKVDSSMRVDGTAGNLGTVVDFETDLGFERQHTLPAAALAWRPGDDWVVSAEYYALGRRSSSSLDRDLVIGDTTYPVNGSVEAGFDSDVYRFTIGNRVFQRQNLEIGLAVGLHATDFTVFVEGEGSVGEQSASFQSERRSAFAPVPTIGAFLVARPAKRVHVSARIDWLSLTISDYSGSLVNTEASVSYRIHKNFDVGVTYRLVDYKLKVSKDDWNGRVDYQFRGPALFVQAGF